MTECKLHLHYISMVTVKSMGQTFSSSRQNADVWKWVGCSIVHGA